MNSSGRRNSPSAVRQRLGAYDGPRLQIELGLIVHEEFPVRKRGLHVALDPLGGFQLLLHLPVEQDQMPHASLGFPPRQLGPVRGLLHPDVPARQAHADVEVELR